MKYRKKPEVVDAVQWNKHGDSEVVSSKALHELPAETVVDCHLCGAPAVEHGFIHPRQGEICVCPGDYVITQADGDSYTMKPDVFKANYERTPE